MDDRMLNYVIILGLILYQTKLDLLVKIVPLSAIRIRALWGENLLHFPVPLRLLTHCRVPAQVPNSVVLVPYTKATKHLIM